MSTLKWDDGFAARFIAECDTGVGKMAAVLQGEMTVTLNTRRIAERRISTRGKHKGRVYWHGPGSPAGTPPNIRSGRLKSSIDFAIPTNLSTRVGTSVPYGRRTEFGFIGMDARGRMYHDPPRPWARPSVTRAKPAMLGAFNAHIRGVLPSIVGRLA